MRAYHFMRQAHGLQALTNQRLKVATLDDLNDPFELLAADLTDVKIRRNFARWKECTSKTSGLLCFSRRWRHPLMWSHYADKHRGVALEVELDDECVVPVRYTASRITLDVPRIMASGGFTADLAEKLASTKSSHWAYEEEIRVAVDLRTCVVDGGLRFEELSDAVKVTGLVAGPLCQVTPSQVEKVLPRGHQLKLQWASLAVGSYNVVPNRAKPVQVIYSVA